jgi:hypothetical protein
MDGRDASDGNRTRRRLALAYNSSKARPPAEEPAMNEPEPSEQQSREATLSIMLTILAVSFFAMVLIVITGGMVIYLLAVVAGLAVFGAMHYFLWGRAFDQATAGEREEEQLREQAHLDGWDLPRRR